MPGIVDRVRERFFTPRLRVVSYEELNAWLLDRCVAYAKAHKHPELTDCTIWQAFEAERPQLVQITGPFDGFHATQATERLSPPIVLSLLPSQPGNLGRVGAHRAAAERYVFGRLDILSSSAGSHSSTVASLDSSRPPLAGVFGS